MMDRFSSFPQIRVFCQNVNRNYGYMDTLLASLDGMYDLLLIQEPPWAFIRSTPSLSMREGEDVVGPSISPNWGCVYRQLTLDDLPHVATYFSYHIKPLGGRGPALHVAVLVLLSWRKYH